MRKIDWNFLNCSNMTHFHWIALKTGNEKKWIDEPPLFFVCYRVFKNYCLNCWAEEEKQGHRYLGHNSISCNCAFQCVCIIFFSILFLSYSFCLSSAHFVHKFVQYREKQSAFHLFLLWKPLYRSTVFFSECTNFMRFWFGVSIIFAIDIDSMCMWIFYERKNFKHSDLNLYKFEILCLVFSPFFFPLYSEYDHIYEEPTIDFAYYISIGGT